MCLCVSVCLKKLDLICIGCVRQVLPVSTESTENIRIEAHVVAFTSRPV